MAAGGFVASTKGGFASAPRGGGGGGVTAISEDTDGNIGIGTSTFDDDAAGSLAIGNGTPPAAGTDGQCSMYAKDSDACVLLLHMNGADGGTTFTDSSPSNHTMVVVGDSHTDTSVKKMGTASYQGDGSTDRLLTPVSSDWAFGTGDFTIEFWFYALDVVGYQMLVSQYAPSISWEFRLNSVGNKIEFLYYSSTTFRTHPTTIVADTWYHVAWVRSGNIGNLYLNGVSTTQATNSTNYVQTQAIGIGARPSGTWYSFNGHIDDLRIMKGAALYAADFTPPAAELGGDTSELYVLDELGNETTISPHNTQNEWVFHSKNKNTGRNVKVNMERMIRRLEELHPGEKFLEEWIE